MAALNPITLQDITDNLNDYIGHYETSSIDPGQRTRAINRAIEYIKRRLSLPCDETISTFLYSQDQMFYDLPDDFDESLQVYYNNSKVNYSNRQWEYRVYSEILARSGEWGNSRFYSFTTINGKKQLVMQGPNLYGGFILDPLNVISNWKVTGDGSGLVVDPNNYPPNGQGVGQGALKFSVTRSSGSVTLTNAVVNYNIQTLLNIPGYVKFYQQLSSGLVDSIVLTLTTSVGNYYTVTVTTDDAGTAFLSGSWDKIGFNYKNVVITGSPNPSSITSVSIRWNLNASYTTGTIWVNDLFETFPDSMNLVYLSQYKGTDSTGVTRKVILTQPSDIVTIGNEFPDFIDMIAMKAAVNVYPSVLGDPAFYSAYTAQLTDIMRTYGRVFPRKRSQNSSYQTVIQRN